MVKAIEIRVIFYFTERIIYKSDFANPEMISFETITPVRLDLAFDDLYHQNYHCVELFS